MRKCAFQCSRDELNLIDAWLRARTTNGAEVERIPTMGKSTNERRAINLATARATRAAMVRKTLTWRVTHLRHYRRYMRDLMRARRAAERAAREFA